MTSPALTTPDSNGSETARQRQRVNGWWAFLFGVAGPAICLIVQRAGDVDVFESYAPPACVLIALEMTLLVAWLVRPPRKPRTAACFAGAFAVGACFAACIGIFLLPLSAKLLLMKFLGLLGFIPFATSYIFGRLALDAWRIARRDEHRGRWVNVLLGATLAVVPAATAEGSQHLAVGIAIEKLREDTPQSIDEARRVLRFVPWLEQGVLLKRRDAEPDLRLRAHITELWRRCFET